MRVCTTCNKKLYGGKHREVSIDGRRSPLCPECGKIKFLAPDGARAEGRVESIHQPLRSSQKGRNIVFHSEKALQNGDRIREAAFVDLPVKVSTLPVEFRVLQVRPLMVVEEVRPESEGGGGKEKKARKRKKRVGYSVRAFSC
jgi:NAD-dependent SIR2 family protein deacetylase